MVAWQSLANFALTPKLQQQFEHLHRLPKPKQQPVMEMLEGVQHR